MIERLLAPGFNSSTGHASLSSGKGIRHKYFLVRQGSLALKDAPVAVACKLNKKNLKLFNVTYNPNKVVHCSALV